MSAATIGTATASLGIGTSPESSFGARGEAPLGEAEAFARVLAAIEGEIATVAIPTIAIAAADLPNLDVEIPIRVVAPMTDVEGEPIDVETEIASTSAAAATPAPLVATSLGASAIPSHDASTVTPPPRTVIMTETSATGDEPIDAPEFPPAMTIGRTAPAVPPTIVARTSHGDPQAPIVEHATTWTATPAAAMLDVELATPVDSPPSPVVVMGDAAPQVREDDAPAPIDVAPVIAAPPPIASASTPAPPITADDAIDVEPAPDAEEVASTPIATHARETIAALVAAPLAAPRSPTATRETATRETATCATPVPITTQTTATSTAPTTRTTRMPERTAYGVATPVEVTSRESAVIAPAPKAPVATVTPKLDVPAPTLDATTPSAATPELRTMLEPNATPSEPAPAITSTPIDRAPTDTAPKPAIIHSRGEDLADAIDQLRPIPRGGATVEVDALGLSTPIATHARETIAARVATPIATPRSPTATRETATLATPVPITTQTTATSTAPTTRTTQPMPERTAYDVATPVEVTSRESAVIAPALKAPVAPVTPTLDVPAPTLVDATTPSAAAPELRTLLEPNTTPSEPAPAITWSPIDRAPMDTAPKPAIILSRAEDLADAIDQLRPIPRGGATVEVDVPGLGAIRLHVEVDGDIVKIRIHGGAEALGWFTREHDGLCSAARQAVPESQSVDLQLHTGNDGRGQSQSQSHARNYPAEGGDSLPQRSRPTAPRHDAATTTAAASPASSHALVDVLA